MQLLKAAIFLQNKYLYVDLKSAPPPTALTLCFHIFVDLRPFMQNIVFGIRICALKKTKKNMTFFTRGLFLI